MAPETGRTSVPTYQYACTECGHEFETVQSFSDASLTECPACTGKLRKVFNAVGIVFKGSGFYRTDSRSGASATSGSDSGSGTDAGTKDKPAAGKDGGKGAASAGSTGSSSSTTSSSPSSSSSSSAAKTGSSTAGSAA